MPKRMKIKLNLPYTIGRKLIHKQREDGYEDNSLEEYIAFLVKDVRFEETTNQATVKAFLEMWMYNFADNLPYIRFGNKLEMKKGEYVNNNLKDIAEPKYPDFEHPPKSSAIVIGRGPSVFLNNHLDMLANAIKNGYKGIISCTDGMLIECLKKGIIPDLTTTVDGAPIIKKYFDHKLVRKYGPQLKIAMNVTVNHQVYLTCRNAGCKVYWFYAMQDDWRQTYSITRLEGVMTKSEFFNNPLQKVACGGNCGYTAWVMAQSLFKRAPIALIGIDFGYPEGCKLEKTTYFSVIDQRVPKSLRPQAVSEFYEDVYHPVFRKKAKIDKVFKSYKKSFLAAQEKVGAWYHHYGGTINCTEGGTLWGNLIICMNFSDFLKRYS